MPNPQQNITQIPSNRVEIIDSKTGMVSREWYRFFLNLFNLAGAGGNQTSLDDLQIGPPPQPATASGNVGTVTSVNVSGGSTGLTTSGGPVTSSGTITLAGTLAVGSGGTGATTAINARSNLSAAQSGANTDITSIALTSGTVTTAPSSSSDLVNKSYADSIASGVNFHAACNYATTTAIASNTYNNGASGVGATLTAVAVGTLTIDGYTFVVGDVGKRILVKNEVTGANNGIYTLTQAGTVLLPYILTRATDYDTSGSGTNEIDQGDLVLVLAGTTNANTSWVQQTPLPITVGTTALVFIQFAAVQTYTAGTGLSLVTNQFSITNIGTANTYGSATAIPVFVTNAQGQVTSVTNTTATPAVGSITGLGSGVSTFLATPTSANLATAVTDETGSGSLVFATSPTLVTPILGTPQSGNFSTGTFTWPTFNQNTTGTASNVTGIVAVANGGSGTATPALVAGTNVTITGSWPNQTINSSNTGGTVTSVAATVPSFLSVTGSPITTSGTLAISYSGTALPILNGGTGQTTASTAFNALSPITTLGDLIYGSATNTNSRLAGNTTATKNFLVQTGTGTVSAAPSWGSIAAADVPTLNQNTTGSAATLTTGRTIAITGDLAYTSPSFNGSASVTAAGTLATVNLNVGSFTNATLTVNGKGLITAASSGTAPVTSVTGISPVVSSGGATPAISLAASYGDTQNPYASKTANFVLAAPNGLAGVPTFRAIVAADIPTLNQNTTGTASNITATSNSTLTTLSVLSLPGSQVSGNISGNAANVTGTVAVANGGTGLATTPANGALDIGNGTGFTRSTLTAGSGISVTNAAGAITIANTSPSSGGTVTSVAALTLGTTGTDLSSSVANSTTTPVITLNVPTASATNRGVLSSADWTTFNNKGSGTVTSVTGTSPVVSSGGTTPAISLATAYGDTLNPYASKTANFFLAAPNGLAGVPTFRAVVAADIPTLNQNTTGTASNVTGTVAVANGGTGLITTPANGALDIGNGTGFTRTTLTAGTNVTITNASGAITINSSNPGGTVTAVSVASANGFAGTSSGGATPALTLSTTITGVLKGNGTAISAATSGTDYSAGTSGLTTGILKSTTTTGALSIAVAGDFPTLNQNTTGSAATLTTPRAIYGNNFDGSAALTQIIASTYGGTGNGFTKFSGATTAEKTYLLPDASTTILTTNAAVTIAQGGTGQTTQQAALTALSGTQTSGQYLRSNGTNTLLSAIQAADVPTLNQNTTGTASNVTGVVAIANGGTGQTTANAGFNALAPSQTSNSGKYLTTDGTNTSWATVASSSNTTAFAFAWFIR